MMSFATSAHLLAVLVALAAVPAAQSATLNAKDFGVKADGVTDDVPTLNRALAAAIKEGPGTSLLLPAGTYSLGERTLLTPGLKGKHQLTISHADGLTVEGEPGALLVTRNLMDSIFNVDQSRNVTIRNLTLDANPLPFTQGVVTAYDAATHSLELQVDKEFDDIDRDDLQKMSQFRIYDNPYFEGFKEDHYFPDLENRVRVGPRHWRLTPSPTALKNYPGFDTAAGKKWMLWSRGYKGWAVRISHSDNCLVENLKIYQAGGSGGFELVNNGSVTIRHNYIGPPPGSSRLFSGGGGAMSFFNRGTVIVEDCDFSHIDDDGFNLGTHFVRVVEKIDAQACRTEAWNGDFQVGDTLMLWDWKQKVERASAKLTSATKERDGRWLLHFDHPLDFVTVGQGPPNASRKEQQFDGIDRLADMESAGSSILRRNRISSMRARCFLVKTGHSVIEDNTFYNTHMPAILAGPEFYWGEAPGLRGLIIRRNVFRNIDAPNISVATFDSPTGISNRDVTIEDNTFEDYGRFPVIYMSRDPQGVAIQVHNTDGVTIQRNHIAPPPAGTPHVDPIVVGSSRNVHVNQ